MSSNKKIIAVVGATGNQGGGVVRDLLQDGSFAVRGLSRNPDSAASKQLSKLGVEVVKADIEDVESLTAAFKDAYGVFGNTDFWSIFAKHNYDQEKTEEHEVQQGKNIVDAAKAAGVTHFVWSTLDHFEEVRVYHFDSKFKVGEYLASSGIPNYTLLYTSAYYSNICSPQIGFMKKDDAGKFVLAIPIPTDSKMHFFDGSDMGKWVVPILKNPSQYSGQRVDAVAEYISPRELAATVKRVTGIPFTLAEITSKQFHDPDFRAKIGDEVWLNMRSWEGGFMKRDMKQSREVAPNLKGLETFLRTDPATRSFLGLSQTGTSA